MKKSNLFIAIAFATSALSSTSALAENSELTCETVQNGAPGAYEMKLKISAGSIMSGRNQAGAPTLRLRDIVVAATQDNYNGQFTTQTGRKDLLNNDASYKPRKYKNMLRFDLSALTDTETFGTFEPGDMCSISLMVPASTATTTVFKAVAVIDCDQSGGSQTLKCSLTKSSR